MTLGVQDVYEGIIANRPGEPFAYHGDGSSIDGLDWQAPTKAPTWDQVSTWATAAATARITDETNEATLRDRADTAIANLESAIAGWSTLTAAQKDAALKLGLRVTAALARLILRRLDSA